LKKPLLALAFIVAIVGCGDKKKVPFLGQWNGQFEVSKVGRGPDTPLDRKHHMLRGYVSIRLDKNTFLLHLEGEQQKVDVKGTWSYAGSQITLDPKEAKVITDGGENGVDPNLKYVPEADLYEAYLNKITLKLSADGSTLTGLTTTIAFLEGIHTFKKD